MVNVYMDWGMPQSWKVLSLFLYVFMVYLCYLAAYKTNWNAFLASMIFPNQNVTISFIIEAILTQNKPLHIHLEKNVYNLNEWIVYVYVRFCRTVTYRHFVLILNRSEMRNSMTKKIIYHLWFLCGMFILEDELRINYFLHLSQHIFLFLGGPENNVCVWSEGINKIATFTIPKRKTFLLSNNHSTVQRRKKNISNNIIIEHFLNKYFF